MYFTFAIYLRTRITPYQKKDANLKGKLAVAALIWYVATAGVEVIYITKGCVIFRLHARTPWGTVDVVPAAAMEAAKRPTKGWCGVDLPVDSPVSFVPKSHPGTQALNSFRTEDSIVPTSHYPVN